MNRLTPLEIQRAAFPRKVHGYDPDAVREFVGLLAQQVEEDNRARAELRAQVARLNAELEDYRARTDALSSALVAAQKAAEATVAQAEERGQHIILEAEGLADRVLDDAARRSATIELVATQLRERRRAARADLKRLAEMLLGLAHDDETAESRDAAAPSIALLRPRRSEVKGER
jgi:cell division initiation protein